ncbi:patched domain-containing protein 3-like [Tiliqua scincoides]|uniref:patched domain-containing protein 3-like n=1 Tax=Tiliqua scincoides TaxID=71010 RepID=UPI003462FCD8
MDPNTYPITAERRPLVKVLRALGASVGAHPWPFLLLPLLLSGALGSGFIYLSSFNAYDMEGLYAPIRNPAKEDRRFIQAHFPTRDAERFSAQRLSTKGAFATFLAVATGDTLLTRVAFTELLALDKAVQGLRTPEHTFSQLCARSLGTCSSPNPLLSALQGEPARLEVLLPNLTWPLAFQGHVFLASFVGGVVLGPGRDKQERPLLAAKALRLLYYLQEDNPLQRKASELWLRNFLQHIPHVLGSLNFKSIKVAYFTSLSRQEMFEKRTKEVLPLLSIVYFLTVFLSIISCARQDCVRTKVWVAAFGVFSAGLSVLSSFGLLLFCGVPFFFTIAITPFLVLALSVHHVFILVSCWQQTKVKESVKDRMADTYAEAVVSVTITILTCVFSFFTAVRESFQSDLSFCIYTGTAFLFCYLYNLTFLGAILALNGRREESNRHWLTFMKVETEPQDSRGRVYNRCCIGGSFDEATGAEIEHPMNVFFRKHYGPFLMHSWSKVVVVVLYLLYLGSSIYGIVYGLIQDIEHQSPSYNSDFIQYYDWEEEYFSEYGPRIMVVVTKSIEYWDPSVRVDLEKCMESLENSPRVDKELSESWLKSYGSVALHTYLNMNNKNVFISNLTILFNTAPESQWDVNFSATEISTSRFYIQTVNVTTVADKRNLLRQLRRRARNCKMPVIVYHPAFIYSAWSEVVTDAREATFWAFVILNICVLLIPSPWSTMLLLLAALSIAFGLSGYMHYWGVGLYPLNVIFFIITLEFSVNFCGCIAYGFLASQEPEVNDKVVDVLYHFGYPVAQGAVSTILGVVVLSGATGYIFRTYFKVLFLVILLAAVHGLVFTPVFLTFCDVKQHGNKIDPGGTLQVSGQGAKQVSPSLTIWVRYVRKEQNHCKTVPPSPNLIKAVQKDIMVDGVKGG